MFWANHKGGPAWDLTDGQILRLQGVEFGEQVIQAPSPFVARGDSVSVVYFTTNLIMTEARSKRRVLPLIFIVKRIKE